MLKKILFLILFSFLLIINIRAEENFVSSDLGDKIINGKTVNFKDEYFADKMVEYLKYMGYNNAKIKQNIPYTQNKISNNWYGSKWNERIFNKPILSYPIDKDADYIVLTYKGKWIWSNDKVWVITLKENNVISPKIIKGILDELKLNNENGYDYYFLGQYDKLDKISYYTDDNLTVFDNSLYKPSVEHNLKSNDKVGWVKSININEGPKIIFDWDCFYANDNSLGDGGYNGEVTNTMALIHSISSDYMPKTFSTGRFDWDNQDFSYYVYLETNEVKIDSNIDKWYGPNSKNNYDNIKASISIKNIVVFTISILIVISIAICIIYKKKNTK